MMRLFVAIEVPESVREALPFGDLKDAITRQGVRFTSPEKIHLTLQFLGNVFPEDVEKLQVALGEVVAKHPAPQLLAHSVGAFPGLHRPAVVYAGVRGDLQALVDDVRAATEPYAERTEDGEYVPHLTLARVSPPSRKVGVALDPVVQRLRDVEFAPWIASDAVLVQTMGDGSHVVCARFPFAGVMASSG